MGLRTTDVTLAQAYEKVIAQAAASRKYAEQQKAAFQQAAVSADAVIAVIQHTNAVLTRFATWSAVPGLSDYAKQQANDPAYDVAAEYIVFRNALRALRDNLIALFPKDGSGFLLYQTLNADGSITTRTFTAAQVSAVLPLFDAVIASVEVV